MSNVKFDAILEAATKLFVRHGYQKTSIDDICGEAKIGKGTVYHYFESKEDIFVAILKKISVDVWADMRRNIDRAGNFEEKFKAFFTVPVDALKSNRQLFMQVLTEDSFSFLQRINEFKSDTEGNFYDVLTSIFQYGVETNVLRKEFSEKMPDVVSLMYRLLVATRIDKIHFTELTDDTFHEIVEERRLLAEVLIKGFVGNG